MKTGDKCNKHGRSGLYARGRATDRLGRCRRPRQGNPRSKTWTINRFTRGLVQQVDVAAQFNILPEIIIVVAPVAYFRRRRPLGVLAAVSSARLTRQGRALHNKTPQRATMPNAERITSQPRTSGGLMNKRRESVGEATIHENQRGHNIYIYIYSRACANTRLRTSS